ncbi:protein kinase superfamily protein [Actinidia rufa]|uniref:Protein kinase superfamily protein n=1 Tax=Actinidia rufa TaxID=165716 RepID=A0A7J0GC26_9ERIC|nr:protein kinase superfamily protein [Actinidia rufa]
MAGKVANRPPASFEFELVEGDSCQLTVKALPSQISLWIDPTTIKLRHRIGRGPFGDVWLATHHQTTENYVEYREVAVKMLHPIREDHIKVVLDKFSDLFCKCQSLKGVCLLQGISIIGGKMCIVMKFYEGSVGDKMSCLKGGKLSLHSTMRYGIDMAQGIMELHSKEILVLNLKPFNFLLNENDGAVLGDFGIPYMLLGIPLPSLDMARRLGTPNYMAPEQWQPELFKNKRSHKFLAVLPPAVENVIIGCFEYDLRSRPVMADILHAFRSSQNAVHRDGGWTGLSSRAIIDKSSGSGYTEWFLAKDHLQVGDMVRSRKQSNSCKLENMDLPEGTIVGLDADTDQNGFVLVRVHGIHDPVRVYRSTLERVTFGLVAGDWVRLKEENKKHSPVGILHSIHRDGTVAVGFIGEETSLEGQFFGASDGGILLCGPVREAEIKYESGSFLADPAQVEVVSFNTCPGVIKKYQHLEDFHWAVRPLLITLGLFTAMKLGLFVGKKVGRLLKANKRQNSVMQCDGQYLDGQNSGNSAWLPPKVANIFREGVGATTTR